MAKKYEESNAVKELATQLASVKTPDAWSGGNYGTAMQDALNKVQNRQSFSYDPSSDALYNSYKNSYMQAGKQAMKDTIGQAASMTGGYGNSYAQNAGQQAYNAYVGKLNDALPTLYQLALDKYDNDTANMVQNYNLLQNAYSNEYNEYQNAVDRANTERSYLASRYDTERNLDYNKYADALAQENYEAEQKAEAEAAALAQQNYLAEVAYQKERDAASDAQWQKKFDESVRQYNASLAASKASSSGGSVGSDTESNREWDADNLSSAQMNKLVTIASKAIDDDNFETLLANNGIYPSSSDLKKIKSTYSKYYNGKMNTARGIGVQGNYGNM